MTKDDLIRLAREAGWDYANDSSGYDPLWKFGELVAAAEREACAVISFNAKTYIEAAEAIRARGQHD
ncbi:hypothetical protein UFOVP382_28 [uncultured Caudovirales phage]|uniref:Uncharacterized protein n=1 Tax=uncultured Caudovirales phage TaxID=2100421 RepID=A0A6J7X2H9_9CAUD|nr:hypothetical protein UFOVP382_28 [uncultured Caudovirales phage]